MENYKDTVDAFSKYLDNISDSKLDNMLSNIDAMGITGPSVEEYISFVTGVAASFLDEPSETSTIEEVGCIFEDTQVAKSSSFRVPTTIPDRARVQIANATDYAAGESLYSKAA